MARQKGIIKLKGTVGDLTFYKSIDGYLVREKGGVEASRIASDPAFVRTRENNAEFGNATQAGKLLRDTVRSLSMPSTMMTKSRHCIGYERVDLSYSGIPA